MSLASQVSELATRVGAEFKTLRSWITGQLAGKANSSHAHAATDTTTGTFALARIPTGTTSSTVALGDHGHDATYARTQTPTGLKNTNYTAALHEIVMVDASAGPVTITLPSISGQARVSVKKVDASANVVTVAAGTATGGAAQTVGSAAAASVPIRLMDQVTTFQGNGTNWVIPYNHLSLAGLDARHAPARPAAHTNFRTRANAATASAIADSGHTPILTTSNGGSNLGVVNGGLGPPPGYTPNDPGGGAINAGYYLYDLGAACSWVGGYLRWDASDTVTASVAIGSFTVPGGVTTTSGSSPMHVAITPNAVQFAVFVGGTNDYTLLTAAGYDSNTVRFPLPMPCDGVTETRVDVIIDPNLGKAWVTIGDWPTLAYSDARIRTAGTAPYPFWEYFAPVNTSNFGRFTDVWADTLTSQVRVPQQPALAAAIAAIGPRTGGAGPPGVTAANPGRPPSKMRHGATWWDTVANTLAASDGTYWRSTAGVIVGNRILHQVATAAENTGNVINISNASISEVRRPSALWRTPRVFRVAATAAGTCSFYVASVPVEAGSAFFAAIAQILAVGTGRSTTVSIRFHNASNAQVGSDTVSTAQTLSTSNPNSILTASATAPTGATQAFVIVTISSAASGQVFYFVDPCLALTPAGGPTHLRT